ncbi:MAG: ArnT family glycosyltransferase [Acidobacteriota bacterium]
MNERSERRVAAWLALVLFGVYLLSFSGMLYSQDSMSMFSVTESVVKRGQFDTDQMWTLFKARNEIARDGESYAKYGYGTSLAAVPLYALALALAGVGLVQTTLLTSSIAIAVTGALVYLASRRLRYSVGASVILALVFGLATPAWVYAKQFWSEPFGLASLFASFYFLLCFREEGHARDAVFAGAAFGLAVATRVTNAALLPVFAWYGFQTSDVFKTSEVYRTRRGVAWFALVLGAFALSIAWYDWVRYGNPLATGYRADETFDNPVLLGLYGLLFSPGKGLFVYVPFLAALPVSFVLFFRRARDAAILIAVLFAYYVLLFSAWYYWWGGTNWGPRFLVPVLPFLVLLVAPAIELAMRVDWKSRTHVAFTAVLFALCLLSVGIEVLGVSVPSLAHRLRMLRISPNPEADAIFLPVFSPLVGYFDLIKPRLVDFAWLRVAAGQVSIDWLVLVLTVAFIAFAVFSLVGAFRGRAKGWWLGWALVLAAVLCLFSLYRYSEDARFGGGDGYRALLQTVQREAQGQDVLILDNDVFATFLFNENRSRIRWYGLSRDPAQWDDATAALLTRLSHQYSRVWFAFDDSTGDLPDPTREWLERSLSKIASHDFDESVHLVLFAGESRP